MCLGIITHQFMPHRNLVVKSPQIFGQPSYALAVRQFLGLVVIGIMPYETEADVSSPGSRFALDRDAVGVFLQGAPVGVYCEREAGAHPTFFVGDRVADGFSGYTLNPLDAWSTDTAVSPEELRRSGRGTWHMRRGRLPDAVSALGRAKSGAGHR